MIKKKKSPPDIYQVLKKYGGPFHGPSKSNLDLEEAIIFALKYCGRKGQALVSGTLPYVIAINAKEISESENIKDPG